ncbi:MAG: methionine--tRNA ligase [Nanoarchaeota archaeon]
MVNFKEKFYVTSAIAYPNSIPHLGHALEIIQADVVARFNRLLGKDVFFQTGTDEHGIKNWQTAEKEGKKIIDFLDANVKVFKELYSKLGISNDQFIRTTDKKMHHPGAIKLWDDLVKAGDIYKKKYKGLYCTGCEAFKTSKELVNDKCCDHPNKKIEIVEEENYFFKLSKYKGKIIKEIESGNYEVIPNTRKNEILSFLEEAKDISFSRPKSSLPWGIQVPDDPEQVMYVWCDALSNYITGVGYGRDDKLFGRWWPADVHVIGKDILRFHAAFWPAMLLSAKLDLPKKLFVHGFILSHGTKMGKSTGNVIEPFSEISKYGVDPFRFYMLEAMPIDSDGEYSSGLVVERINSELVGNLSNFCYRAISFTNKNFDSKIDEVDDDPVIKEIENRFLEIKKAYSEFDFKKAVDGILSVSALGNKYFQEKEPWKLINEDREKVHRICGLVVNIAKDLSILLSPVMPTFSSLLQEQLNVKDLRWGDLGFGLKDHKLNSAEIIFKKAEVKEKEVFPLDLRVAEIKEVKEHPEADKLYILNVDVGSEERQLVAGLKEHYSESDLLGKKVIIVANLKPAKLRGVLSQGMVLAAESKKEVGVLYVEDVDAGLNVSLDGLDINKSQVRYEDFAKLKINAVDGKVEFKSSVFKVKNEFVKVDKVLNGKIC